ncbi:TM0106 family RecB-like putative nuclease [Candidatus Woesearchaeota archaeon]|nr:TM0106 family RecB-like putative nuclease [Candidatus Woesearchaeota archaeon]
MKPIRATNFYGFVKCPRKVYLYFFGDPTKKIPYSEFLQQKMKEGRDYEREIISKFRFAQPEEALSYKEAAEQTLKFMKNKEKLIYQPVIIQDNLIGIPDFLEIKKGKSKLGNYYYQPMDIKTGLSAKKKYTMQLCFYCYLLEDIQGFSPDKFKLWLGDGSIMELKTQDYFNKFADIFSKIKDIAGGKKEQVHICGACKDCQWKDFCFSVAEKEDHLSLIFNISRNNIRKLKDFGVKNLKDAAKINIDELSKVKGFGKTSLKRWKLQARSLISGKSVKLSSYPFPDVQDIYFDIEDTQIKNNKIVYLFGMVIDKEYKYFLAEKPSEEKKAWKSFLDFFKDKKQFNLYVYSGHEKSMLKKLFKKYGGDKKIFDRIISNLIDLLSVVKKTTIFPVYSYSIKDIAKFLGFRWSSKDASGSQSLLWYSEWMATNDKKHLNKILEYNKEDCLAEIAVKEHIENQNY